MRDAQPAAGKLLPLRLVQHAAVREPAVVLVPADAPVDMEHNLVPMVDDDCCWCAAPLVREDDVRAGL